MSQTPLEPAAPLVEHFFRHEAGRLVAVLTRLFGWRNFDLVEDMVQATLLDALQAWRVRAPDNPSAWVHRVAKNKILDALRRDKIGQRVMAEWAATRPMHEEGLDELFLETAIRADLCEEAARLCHLLCSQRRFSTPPTHALMALMLFHAARLEARLNQRGSILLMEEQDRSKWDRRLIRRGQEFLDQSAEGTVISPFHLEAAIACLHCTAPSYAETDWPAILRLYDALLTINGSPVYLLNRAIVLAQIEGPHAGIRALDEAGQDPALRHYHLFDATLGELYRRAGDLTRARQHFEAARQKTSSPCDRELIDRRLSKCA